MLKKAIFVFFAVMLVVSSFGLAQAQEIIDGLAPFNGPTVQQPYINPGGLGDSLLYGYYNVRGNLNLFNIVNTSTVDGQKVRVVFRNAKNSRECLDFSVCLSKGDVWTAYLVDNGTTASICPLEPVHAGDNVTLLAPTIPAGCQSFKYEGAGGVTGVTADDCREGYFEVIGLTRIPNYDSNASLATRQAIPMATEGDCRDWAPSGAFYDAGNVLMGNNTIVDFSNLATYSANAVAVANTALDPVVITPGVEKTIPEAMATSYLGACDIADFIFMKSDIISPYDLLAAIAGETEVTMTFPTRLACHNTASSSDMFEGDKDPNTSGIQYCTSVGLAVWDDSEHRLDITDFSPSIGRCLPYEVNVIRLGGSHIWNSTVANAVSVGSFDLGWIDIDLVAGVSYHTVSLGGWTSVGLPAVASTSQSIASGFSSYMLPTIYKTIITPAG